MHAAAGFQVGRLVNNRSGTLTTRLRGPGTMVLSHRREELA